MRCGIPLALLLAAIAAADGPSDNLADKVRPVPPAGIAVPPEVRAKLTAKLGTLRAELPKLPAAAKTDALKTDVEVFARAVGMALDFNEFFHPRDFAAAEEQLDEGLSRCRSLAKGEAPWATQKGLVVRGYRSQIDGSVQPYGLVVPENFDPKAAKKHRLDLWLHGRYENVLEVQFIQQRRKDKGEFTPAGAFVLHPFGRFSNAFRFAGEVDVHEALSHVQAHYPIDENRLVDRGFSMGGAGCWQFATRNPGMWAAAAPGAGFSETAEFLKVFQSESLHPTWFEQKLWRLYDSTGYAGNLFNVPTIAYSGEVDRQKQAADAMHAAAKAEGLDFPHLIGPKTAHKYHPATRDDLNRRIDAVAEKGRAEFPKHIKFTTFTLAASECRWLQIAGLEKHWERAEVDARIVNDVLTIATKNVASLSFAFPVKAIERELRLVVDAQELGPLRLILPHHAAATYASVRKQQGKWRAPNLERGPEPAGKKERPPALAKSPGHQGPIDDAFMGSFVFVKPTGKPRNAAAGAFAEREMAHATKEWRRHFRGDVRIKNDTEIGKADIEEKNLILFGDSSSNAIVKKIADKLPAKWSGDTLEVAGRKFPAATHMPALIYPNPLNPAKYVVLNSGFTFREYDYLNNARQTPKLPDWAVFDATTPMTSRAPGKRADAGFFGEQWEPLPDGH